MPPGGQAPSTPVSRPSNGEATPERLPHLDPLASWLPRRRADLIAGCAVAAIGFFAFANSLWNEFVFDDVVIIETNTAIRSLQNLRAIFAHSYWPAAGDANPLYRPFVIFSYALNYALAGLRPFSYHLINVLLHAANSALIYRLIVSLRAVRGLALLAAATFALHPIHTEAVANTVGRAELLATAFLLLSWWWYVKRETAPAPIKTRWLAASVAAFALALFTKEHAAVLPGLLVLTDLFRASERRRPLGETLREHCRVAYVWYIPPLVGYLVARHLVLGEIVSSKIAWLSNPLAHTDPWTRALTAIKVLGHYVWLLLVPIRLSADYSYNQIPISHSFAEPAVVDALLVLVALVALAVWSRRRRPVLSFGIAIFGLTILLVSNLPFPIGTIMAERLLYLPSLGFCIALAAAVGTLAARPRLRVLTITAVGLLLLGYGARTVVRNQDWRSNATLFRATAQTSPSSATAHVHYGGVLLKSGDLVGARREFERSLEIHPGYGKALARLGKALQMQGLMDEAIRVYRLIPPNDKYYVEARVGLGHTALAQGRASEALAELREAARLGFTTARDSNDIAEGLYQLGLLTEAQAVLEAAKRHTLHDFDVRRNLALVYWRQGRLEDARRELEAAARLSSDSTDDRRDIEQLSAAFQVPPAAPPQAQPESLSKIPRR